MLTTDRYCYLDVDDPICAWATTRGVLVSASEASDQPGFVSRWFIGLIASGNEKKLQNELAIEAVRRARFPYCVSRLRAVFVFDDVRSAQRAASDWGGPFSASNLAELSFAEVRSRNRVDANWISEHLRDHRVLSVEELGWIDRYWSGVPYPGSEPLWECLVEGRVSILGTELRMRAFDRVKDEFPDSLTLVEVSRAAAWIGSDFGNVAGFLWDKGSVYELGYWMNNRDETNSEFRRQLLEPGVIANPQLLRPDAEGNFGKLPDLRPYGFTRPKFVA